MIQIEVYSLHKREEKLEKILTKLIETNNQNLF